jgi:hypothetical protein
MAEYLMRGRQTLRRMDCKPEVATRWLMPYGIWTCADGREVLFDRIYKPICDRRAGEQPKFCDPDEWVSWVKQDRFYDDSDEESDRRKAAQSALVDWGVEDMVMDDIRRIMRRTVVA